MELGQGRNPDGQGRNRLPASAVHFSLDQIETRDQLAQWQDVLCNSITGCRAQVSDWAQEFRADFDLVAGERVSIAHSRTYGIGTVRDRDCIRDDDDHLVMFMKLDGVTQIDMRDQRFLLTPGDAVLVDFAQTFDMQAAGTNCDLLVLRLPRQLVGVDRRSIGVHHKAGAPLLRLLRGYASEVFAAGAAGAELHPVAERHLAELVSTLCLQPSDEQDLGRAGALNAARLTAIREQVALNYRDPCLTLRKVAANLGFSERLGQLILSRAGTSFTDLVQQHRLDRAYEMLSQPGRRVMDAAYAVGFSDLSHFHRLYRARFGCTPGDTREAAQP
jgi:AraC-like DNA-binding protein